MSTARLGPIGSVASRSMRAVVRSSLHVSFPPKLFAVTGSFAKNDWSCVASSSSSSPRLPSVSVTSLTTWTRSVFVTTGSLNTR